MKNTAVSNNETNRYTKFNTSQPSLWDEDAQEDRQQELIDTLSAWASLNAYPELPGVGVKPGRANWTIESWDLPRLETVHQAADLFSKRWRAYFALTHWAIEHGHPCLAKTIDAGLTNWTAWCKDASLDDLRRALDLTRERQVAHA